MRALARLVLAAALALAAPALCGQPATLKVGSKRFTESYILGEILRQSARSAGEATVLHEIGLGNTGIVFAALRAGRIDVYPEYTGTIAREILRDPAAADLASLARGLAPLGLGVAVPLGFGNSYALAMREDLAAKLGVTRISDLARHPDLRLALSQEFLGRADGWEGLKRAYALPFPTPRGVDHGLAYAAIDSGQVDVTDIYTTDAKIARHRLRVLEDDRGYFPRYDALLLHRLDLPQRLPATWAALAALEGRIDQRTMIGLNAEAELQGRDFAAIAADFLVGRSPGAPAPGRRLTERLFGDDLGRLTGEHLLLTFGSLAAAVLLGVPLGVLAARAPAAGRVVLAAVALIQTVPALALLAFLISLLGSIGTAPALAALFLYALLPIVRNTATGLADIPAPLRESALALGLPATLRLARIELPLAAGAIVAGVQTSAVINVGTATIAAFVGAGGYGERIVQGLALNDPAMLLAGAIPAAALALATQLAFDALRRATRSPGLG